MQTRSELRRHGPEEVVRLARGWIGTPYHHQASAKGVGTDCLGLVRGVWRELYGAEAELPPGYSRDWGDTSGRETLLEAARRHLVEIEAAAAQPGDIVIFRLRAGLIAKHAGIVATDTTFIHAKARGSTAARGSARRWRTTNRPRM